MPPVIVVESAGKQRFVSDLLRKASLEGWTVVSCQGHYCGLPKNSLGIDPKTFQFTWKVRHTQAFERVRKAVASADVVYAATDTSPEGEAIAHQVSITAEYATKPFHRLRLSSLDVDSLKRAISTPSKIDQALLQSYLAREAVDRIAQFVLSPVLEQRLGPGLQINRIALPLLSELARVERKIRAFSADTVWVVRALLADGSTAESGPMSQEEAERIANKARIAKPAFYEAKELGVVEPPFTLSTLIQFVSKRYGLDALSCVRVCETLFSMGLITYPFTDSCFLSEESASRIHSYVREKLSARLAADTPVVFGSPSSLGAICPVQISLAPSQLDLSGDLRTVYSAIWFRACGCQGRPAHFLRQKCTYFIEDEEAFVAEGLALEDAGWHQLSGRLFCPILTPLEPDSQVEEASVFEHASRPPKRHTHGSLVSWLDAHFIGRPWVYQTALEFLQSHGYAETMGGGLLRITPKGEAVLTFIRRSVKDLIDPDFGAEVEEDISAVEQGHRTFEQFFSDQWQWATEAAAVMGKKSLRPKFKSPETGAKLRVQIDKDSGRPYVRAPGEEWWSYVSFDEKGQITVSPEEV